MRKILITFLVTCLLVSCNKKDTTTLQSTLANFQSALHGDMNYDDIIETFGEPDNDVGSGIHIYVYTLSDSTEIWIGYTDYILYARHMDQNQNIIHTLY